MPKSWIGGNINTDGSLGEFEIVRSKSEVPACKGKWWVSLRDGDRQWWHGKADLTEKEAEAVCRFLSNLSDVTLQMILKDKLIVAAQPLRQQPELTDRLVSDR